MDTSLLPMLTPKQVVKALKKMGYEVVQTRHSHKLLANTTGRRIVVPIKRGRMISPVLLHLLLKDTNVSIEKFAEFL